VCWALAGATADRLLVAIGLTVEGTHFGIWFGSRFDLSPALIDTGRYLRRGGTAVLAVLAAAIFGPGVKAGLPRRLT
jgi:hypothetical protein